MFSQIEMQDDLYQNKPNEIWSSKIRNEVVDESAVIYTFSAPELRMSIQANLDGWPDIAIGKSVMVRFGAQSNCAFNCNFCVASQNRFAQNLSVEQMVSQVVEALCDPLIRSEQVEQLTIASFGLGEPLFNPHVPAAFQEMRRLLPEAELIVSTTGPRSGERVFAQLEALADAIGKFRLQISLHYTTDEERRTFAGGATHPIAGLSDWVQRWNRAGGLTPFINCGIGPLFPIWDEADYARLLLYFPPDQVVIKLSTEAPLHPDEGWKIEGYRGEMEDRIERLTHEGYRLELYDPAGLAEGAGCGSQL